MSSVTLSVAGVNCGGCAGTVTKALEAVEGVTSVSVSLDFVGGDADGERALNADGKKMGTAVVVGEAELSALLTACEVAGKPATLSSALTPAAAADGH